MGSAICYGSNRYYVARTRWIGCRKYDVVSKHRTRRAAMLAVARAMAANSNLKRGDVLLCADYYDPVMICELVQ